MIISNKYSAFARLVGQITGINLKAIDSSNEFLEITGPAHSGLQVLVHTTIAHGCLTIKKIQSRSKFSISIKFFFFISLENFNLEVSISPQK